MKSNNIQDWLQNDLLRFIISITPAVLAAMILYLLGPKVYLPVSAVVSSFYFAVGVGWVASPIIGLSTGIHPVWLVLLLIFISSESSLIVSLNYDLLEKVPLIGKLMRWIRKKGEGVIEKHELAKDVEFITIFWLMFTPLYGTGPMAMTMVGRLLALSWKKTWMTITLSATARFTFLTFLLYFGWINF
ncbi:MAG: small multi-drug export protein [Thermoplasmatota archaeon]